VGIALLGDVDVGQEGEVAGRIVARLGSHRRTDW
jgi:hypothetical protein